MSDEKLYCPLCGKEVVVSRDDLKNEVSICCFNPNCLNPRTGWGTEVTVLSKWNKFVKLHTEKKNA